MHVIQPQKAQKQPKYMFGKGEALWHQHVRLNQNVSTVGQVDLLCVCVIPDGGGDAKLTAPTLHSVFNA